MDNEEIQGVKFSEFQSATPGNNDEVVGLHSGNNARFSVANFILAVRQGVVNLFVPTSRTVNGKALSADITLDASDVGAYELPAGGIPATDLANGVIPTVPSISTSAPNMDGTGAAGSTGEVSDAGHVHPSDTSKADETELAYVESGSTATRNYTEGQYFTMGGVLHQATTAIASGASFNSGSGGNCVAVSGGGLNDLMSAININTVVIVGGDWTACPQNHTRWYKYEGNIAGVSLPNPYVFVCVTKASNNRGIAVAYRWSDGANTVWTNRLHDTWKGWIQVSSAVNYATHTATGTASYGIINLPIGANTFLLNAVAMDSTYPTNYRFDTANSNWIVYSDAFKGVQKTISYAYINI